MSSAYIKKSDANLMIINWIIIGFHYNPRENIKKSDFILFFYN